MRFNASKEYAPCPPVIFKTITTLESKRKCKLKNPETKDTFTYMHMVHIPKECGNLFGTQNTGFS